ncbi:MAG: pyrroline-5-carboxylate reductase, partial [Planctomycetota bacterium]|nr:pyrroline-5-carboxylate reductase [Planctomycetota bacterium]
GFIGTGQMATALASGFSRAGKVEPDQICGFDTSSDALDRFCTRTGGQPAESNAQVVEKSDLVFLAVKPQIVASLTGDLKNALQQASGRTIVSVMGGVPLKWLVDQLGTQRVIRTMPNTPCLIGKGATGIAGETAVERETVEQVLDLFHCVGIAFELPERLIDAVTGISGSGPAYVFQFIEALSDGAVCAGIPRDIAIKLAAQTVMGAGQMVLETAEHPGVLKDRVASPGGTTIAGLRALEEGGFRSAAINAVVAATERSVELGR